jgi:hypothetical protein
MWCLSPHISVAHLPRTDRRGSVRPRRGLVCTLPPYLQFSRGLTLILSGFTGQHDLAAGTYQQCGKVELYCRNVRHIYLFPKLGIKRKRVYHGNIGH